MDQTIINATEEFLKNQITQKDERIQSLEEHIQRLTQRSYSDSADRNRIVEGMQEWTLEQLKNDSITSSQAEEIAEICGFELTKEVEVEVNVTYSMTLQVPYDEDAEDIVNDIDFDAITYDTDKVSWVSSTIDSIDF